MIAWMTTSLFGGMLFYLFLSGFALLPIAIGYIISLLDFCVTLCKRKTKTSKIKKYSHLAVGFAMVALYALNSETFKSKAVLSATLKDDLFHYQLIFRENGRVENHINGFAGFSQTHHGKYSFRGDTIIFSQVPYDNDFIPDTMYLNKAENAIFLDRNEDGSFSSEKMWLNHFEVNKK
ncbi:hypothetical protein GGR28_003492 [Lewinella aquimaris]|uniref:Uncharacterized protein n=1 Tax=Neolewinella aquimaris TaxID=1835722 RepID=A0A840EA84_9BACT|nr:hypothetical protein [Neolewinella aquimaris]MBB4080853.1 hypothetical protein [Neolewinella aquimaris]